MALAPCSGCDRHVHVADVSCPFCGASTAAVIAPRVRISQRLGRLAVFTALLGSACGSSTSEETAREPVVEEPIVEEPIAEEAPPPEEPVEERVIRNQDEFDPNEAAGMYGGPPIERLV
jgi:hypothetical protein